jgi:hypothetical protein
MRKKSSGGATQDKLAESLQDVLVRVAGEMCRIAETMEETHFVVTRLTWQHASKDPDYGAAMQKADLVAQELSGLAGFIQQLMEGLPHQVPVDATQARQGVKLSDLARRLAA